MKKNRTDLEKYLIKKICAENNTYYFQQKYIELESEFNIPINMSSDIMSLRKDISEYNEFILFAITKVVDDKKIGEYFTDKEIEMYANGKYTPDKIKFPIELQMLKVADDQYIGVTSAQFLMQLREAQLINYNADTQRALRIVYNGGKTVFRPYINASAVKEIKQAYADKTFIPNTISLNINLDDEKADYHYYEKTCTFKINSLTAFDLFDGYHRYLGMAGNYDKDDQFDYPMELRITLFSVGKAKQFIFQEDHKTKMRKVESSTFDQYDAGNIIVNRLNSDPENYLNGNINLQDGLINSGILGQTIDKLWFKKTKPDRKEIIEVTKTIKTKLNMFLDAQDRYVEKKWQPHEIIIIFYGFSHNYSNEQIMNAIHNISKDNVIAIDRIQNPTAKVLNMVKEVY